MNTYVTAEIIKQLREKKGLTQSGLAKIIGVSDKAVSKWETGKGLPDISLIEPLSAALSVSVAELLSGECHGSSKTHGSTRLGAPYEQHPQPCRRDRTERNHLPINAKAGKSTPRLACMWRFSIIKQTTTSSRLSYWLFFIDVFQ